MSASMKSLLIENQRNKDDIVSIFFTCMFSVFLNRIFFLYYVNYGILEHIHVHTCTMAYMQRSSFLNDFFFYIQVHVNDNVLVTRISTGIEYLNFYPAGRTILQRLQKKI